MEYLPHPSNTIHPHHIPQVQSVQHTKVPTLSNPVKLQPSGINLKPYLASINLTAKVRHPIHHGL